MNLNIVQESISVVHSKLSLLHKWRNGDFQEVRRRNAELWAIINLFEKILDAKAKGFKACPVEFFEALFDYERTWIRAAELLETKSSIARPSVVNRPQSTKEQSFPWRKN